MSKRFSSHENVAHTTQCAESPRTAYMPAAPSEQGHIGLVFRIVVETQVQAQARSLVLPVTY